MSPLRSAEVKIFSEAVEKIHSATDLDNFAKHIFAVFESLIPGSVFTLDEFNLKTGVARDAISRPPEDYAGWRERLTRLIPLEHPVFPTMQAAEERGSDLGILKISDFTSVREFKRKEIYHEVFAPIGARHQIVLPLRLPGHVAGLTISRREDFSESEMTLAELLSPHLALAHIHAQTLSALREVRGEAVLPPDKLRVNGLTQRESEVLHWIIQGKRNSEIAAILRSSPRTVAKQVQHILAKLNVETRTAAASEALRLSSQGADEPTSKQTPPLGERNGQ